MTDVVAHALDVWQQRELSPNSSFQLSTANSNARASAPRTHAFTGGSSPKPSPFGSDKANTSNMKGRSGSMTSTASGWPPSHDLCCGKAKEGVVTLLGSLESDAQIKGHPGYPRKTPPDHNSVISPCSSSHEEAIWIVATRQAWYVGDGSGQALGVPDRHGNRIIKRIVVPIHLGERQRFCGDQLQRT